jgi:hypothetical protein
MISIYSIHYLAFSIGAANIKPEIDLVLQAHIPIANKENIHDTLCKNY